MQKGAQKKRIKAAPPRIGLFGMKSANNGNATTQAATTENMFLPIIAAATGNLGPRRGHEPQGRDRILNARERVVGHYWMTADFRGQSVCPIATMSLNIHDGHTFEVRTAGTAGG